MEDEFIFLQTLNDIRQKANGQKYDLIRACALLRQLFLDKNPLVHIVNRQYGLKIEFHVSDYKRDDMPLRDIISLHWVSLLPRTKQTFKVDLSEFLKIVSLTYNKHEYTVKDIILTTAHVCGGVHSYKPQTPQEQSLYDLIYSLSTHGVNAAYQAINSISWVCIEALNPLENVIKEK